MDSEGLEATWDWSENTSEELNDLVFWACCTWWPWLLEIVSYRLDCVLGHIFFPLYLPFCFHRQNHFLLSIIMTSQNY